MENLSELRQAADLQAANATRKEALIVEAREDGWPWPRIAEAARMTVMGAQQAARRVNDGELPKPRQR